MIVECHDSLNPLITQIRQQRFSASHDIENISEGPRDPNRFASLRLWESLDRWFAIDEGPSVDHKLAGLMGALIALDGEDRIYSPPARSSGGPGETRVREDLASWTKPSQ